LHPNAQIPSKGTEGSIGLDIISTTTTIIQPGQLSTIPTGLATAFSNDVYLRIAPRSSISKQQISVEAGVVDSDYRGEIKVMLQNNSNIPFHITSGDKIAQFIFEKATTPLLIIQNKLPPTKRGKGHFGSTNKTKPNISTFRINNKELLIIDKTKCMSAKRVHAPIAQQLIHPNDLNHHHHPNKNNYLLQPHNSILLHEMNMHESTAVDKALQMVVKKIPSINPNIQDHQVHPSNSIPIQASSNPTTLPPYRPNSSQSKLVLMSTSNLLKSIGFLKMDQLAANLHKLGKKNFIISKLPRDPKLDPGETATLNKAKRNTTPIEPPSDASKIFNIDIVFGPSTSIGGARYALLQVNKKNTNELYFSIKELDNITPSSNRTISISVWSNP
jgi:dUTP pyrophosphatase